MIIPSPRVNPSLTATPNTERTAFVPPVNAGGAGGAGGVGGGGNNPPPPPPTNPPEGGDSSNFGHLRQIATYLRNYEQSIRSQLEPGSPVDRLFTIQLDKLRNQQRNEGYRDIGIRPENYEELRRINLPAKRSEFIEYARRNGIGDLVDSNDGWLRDRNGRAYHLHHIIPLAQGGTNDIENLIPLEPHHHVQVHRELNEWANYLRNNR